MGEWIVIILLGVLQGATEFLPISSSGHLSLAHAFFGGDDPSLLTDVVLHAGTLVAVLAMYRADVLAILRSVWGVVRRLPKQGWRGAMQDDGFALATYVIVATVVTGVLGLALKEAVEGVLRGPEVVGSLLLVNGVILWSARGIAKASPSGTTMPLDAGLSVPRALAIGFLQGLAVVPGISRSGLTITGALWLGMPGPQAARYSFLLSVPAILGAVVLKLSEVESVGVGTWMRLGLGMIVAALVGYVCLVFLVKLLHRARFHHFAWYCWGLGTVVLVWSALV